jgi:hypothetical protein
MIFFFPILMRPSHGMTRNKDKSPKTKEGAGHGKELYAQSSRENVRQYRRLAGGRYRVAKTHF